MRSYFYNYKGKKLLHAKEGVRVIQVGFQDSAKYPAFPATSVLKIQSLKRGAKEYQIIGGLSHSNIVKFYHYYIENGKFYIFFENGKTDFQVKMSRRKASGILFLEFELTQILFKLAKALQYIHKRRIAHRDIKPLNIIENQDGEIKLIDFGEAKFIREQDCFHSLTGTISYMSPQLRQAFEQRSFNIDPFSDDIWALGITMVELALLDNIYNLVQSYDCLPGDIFQKLAASGYSQFFIGLIERMLEINPLDRAQAEDLLVLITEQENRLDLTESMFVPAKRKSQEAQNEHIFCI